LRGQDLIHWNILLRIEQPKKCRLFFSVKKKKLHNHEVPPSKQHLKKNKSGSFKDNSLISGER